MTKLLVVYYSMYGHIETMAEAVAEGARSVTGVEVELKRVADTIPSEQAAAQGVKLDQKAPVASPDELGDNDANAYTFRQYGRTDAEFPRSDRGLVDERRTSG